MSSASSLRAPALVLGATRCCRRTRARAPVTAVPLCKSQAGAADAVALSPQRRALLLAAGVATLLPAQRARAVAANPEPLDGGACMTNPAHTRVCSACPHVWSLRAVLKLTARRDAASDACQG
jgi:D-aminopeptidase